MNTWVRTTSPASKTAMAVPSPRLSSCTLLVGLVFLLSSPAMAGELANKAALEAFSVVNEHCADVGVADVTRHATSVSKVAPAWAAVSEAYEAEGEAFLLYWRGVLAQCLDYQDKAKNDLKAFVAQFAEEAENVAQVRDARIRLRRLGVKLGGLARPGPVAEPGAIPGVLFASGAGALAALVVVRGIQVQEIEDSLENTIHARSSLGNGEASIEGLQQKGEDYALSANVALAGSISCAVASIVSFAVWRARGRSSKRALRGEPSMMFSLAADVRGGLSAAWAVTW